MIETESVYIPGLRLFDMFNDMSNEIYGRGPLMFVPLHHQTVRIEFDPKDGNQVLDRNVPANDPRMQWTTDEHGEGVPPRATKFTEFVCILWNLNRKVWEPIVISIKETNKFQRRAAEKLLGYVKFQDGPIFAGYKHVESKPEKNDSGTFGVYRFDNAGFIEDEQFYNMCKKQALGFEGKVVETTREAGDETGDGEVVNATSSKEVPF
jgi:hypothetical protein